MWQQSSRKRSFAPSRGQKDKMASCECCWRHRDIYTDDPGESYHREMREHEARGCVCTKTGIEGDKARAGDFWQNGHDIRNDPEPQTVAER